MYSPTYITLLERPVETAASYAQDDDDDRQTSIQNKLNRLKQNKNKKNPRPVSKEITSHTGSFVERIHEDAVVDVCVRASGAGQRTPMRFGLRTEALGDKLTELEREFDDKKTKSGNVDHHWTFLDTQMDRIEHEMHTIISEADFFKERDSIYHQQTNALHQATTFWPILHIIILLVTGFTQGTS
jgi:emp24/gp25L/p24 family/GOLD